MTKYIMVYAKMLSSIAFLWGVMKEIINFFLGINR